MESADGLWDVSEVPAVPNWPDPSAGTTGVELGTRFMTNEDIWVVGVRFYKGDLNTGQHLGSLWTSDGALLSSGMFVDETASGWQDLIFDDPVMMSPGVVYVASYFSPTANYSAENNYFDEALTTGPVTAIAGANGVYRYNGFSVYPEFTYLNSTYWVTPLWSVNAPPVVDAGADTAGTEGASIPLLGSAVDPEGEPLDIAWTVVSGPDDGGACTLTDPSSLETALVCDDDGEVIVSLSAADGVNEAVSDRVVVSVSNGAPSVTSAISSPSTEAASGSPIPLGEAVELASAITDPGANDTHTCSIDWGDGVIDMPAIIGATCDGSHSYSQAGVYTVTTTITDDDAGVGSGEAMVVIYDSSGGFVTGGGWIDSPAGAYVADPTVGGRANFGFVSKYKKGASVPTGNTTFRFRNASFSLKSDSYDWLIVTGSDQAKFKGWASVDGVPGYQFQIWAGDGRPDTFRLKVWTSGSDGTEQVVYDNGSQQLLGGSVTVHK